MEFIIMNVVIPFGIIAVMHFWVGRYPEPYQKSNNKKREIIEILGLWLFVFVMLSVFTASVPLEAYSKMPSNSILLNNIAYMIIPLVIAPLLYVIFVQKWNRFDLGFCMPKSWPMVIFAVSLFALAGILPLLFGQNEGLPWALLAFAFYQPAFTEELFFRVILQGKLERALGQNKAWFYSGILFGLIHVPVDFFGPQWYSHGESVMAAFLLLFGQITSGWIFGIIYSKTRSIFPGMLAHFVTDGRLSSIFLNIIH